MLCKYVPVKYTRPKRDELTDIPAAKIISPSGDSWGGWLIHPDRRKLLATLRRSSLIVDVYKDRNKTTKLSQYVGAIGKRQWFLWNIVPFPTAAPYSSVGHLEPGFWTRPNSVSNGVCAPLTSRSKKQCLNEYRLRASLCTACSSWECIDVQVRYLLDVNLQLRVETHRSDWINAAHSITRRSWVAYPKTLTSHCYLH